MRLLMINPHPDRPDSYIYKSLHQSGEYIEVICDQNAVRFKELKAAGLSITKLPFRYRVDIPVIRAIRDKLRVKNFDIAYAFSKRSLSNLMIASICFPVQIVTYRGIIGNLHSWNPETRLTFMNKRVKKIICVCDAVKKYLISLGINKDCPVTVHKGHNISWYKSASRSDLLRFGIPRDVFVVGCAARMRKRKGIKTLIDAARILAQENVHFLLVGEIKDREIKRQITINNLDNIIHLTGFLEDAASLMGACDVFVMPSLRREGLPRAVIEAMAQGVPAIVTNVGGMPEIVDDQKDGFVVESGNPEIIAKTIQYLINNPELCKFMGIKARDKIKNKFNIDNTVKIIRDILKQLI